VRSFSRTLALAATIAALTTCFSQEEEFALGRLENPCAGSIPICAFHAACVLGRKDFLSGQMPGGQRFIIQSDRLDRRLVIRLLFTEMIYPGTEFLLNLYTPGCGSRETEHIIDQDLFARAGDDRIVTFIMPLEEEGDHLLELFSDMSAAYLLTIDLER
jgi:hypothetical protein